MRASSHTRCRVEGQGCARGRHAAWTCACLDVHTTAAARLLSNAIHAVLLPAAPPFTEPAKKKGRKKDGGDAAAAAAAGEAAGADGKDGDKEPEHVLWRVNYDEFNRRWAGWQLLEGWDGGSGGGLLHLLMEDGSVGGMLHLHNSARTRRRYPTRHPPCRFRNDVIVKTVKAKHGADAGNAVLGLLLANARFEASVRPGRGWG